jgi:hypothetical protein
MNRTKYKQHVNKLKFGIVKQRVESPVQSSLGAASSINGSAAHASRISFHVPKLEPLRLQLNLSFWHWLLHIGSGELSIDEHLGNNM